MKKLKVIHVNKSKEIIFYRARKQTVDFVKLYKVQGKSMRE